MTDVNDVIIPFEGSINPGYPKGIKLYLQAKKVDRQINRQDRYFSFK